MNRGRWLAMVIPWSGTAITLFLLATLGAAFGAIVWSGPSVPTSRVIEAGVGLFVIGLLITFVATLIIMFCGIVALTFITGDRTPVGELSPLVLDGRSDHPHRVLWWGALPAIAAGFLSPWLLGSDAWGHWFAAFFDAV